MFFDELAELFNNIHIVPLIFIIVGTILLMLEMFVIPGFGAAGIFGILSFIAALISHLFITGSFAQFIMLFFILLLILVMFFIVLISSAKKGIISKTPFILEGSSVSDQYFEKAEKEIKGLLGKTGICISKIDPVGIILINGKEYEASTRSGVIDKDCEAKVVSVEKLKIFVERC